MFRSLTFTSLLVLAVTSNAAARQNNTPPPAQTPIPKPAPFPGANQPATPAPPSTAKPVAAVIPQNTPPQDGAAIDPKLAGVPMYPGAELLSSFDTGRGQQVFLLGSTMPYSDVVGFYKLQLRTNGSEVFKTPPVQQFDLGPFRSETMAYRPGVVVKDYSTADSAGGYLHVSGTIEKRYRTVIQIVR